GSARPGHPFASIGTTLAALNPHSGTGTCYNSAPFLSSGGPGIIIVEARDLDHRPDSLFLRPTAMNGADEPKSGEEGPPPSTATSRSLLERVKADDAVAWDRLVGLYAPL